MAAVKIFLSFGLMAITNKAFEFGMRNLAQMYIVNMIIHDV
jgi:hypothetical protein